MLPAPRNNSLIGPKCPHAGSLVRHGSFRRKDDGETIHRWRCKRCRKTVSEATNDLCFRQHKRKVNARICYELVSGMSQRRIARGVFVNRKTVIRKFLWLSIWAKGALERYNAQFPPAQNLQFDEMESFEHTKCKPLSMPLAVQTQTRRILAVRVCSMPAKGRLAKIAVKKYGYRKDDRKATRLGLLRSLKSKISPEAIILTDKNPFYPSEIKKVFPNATHKTTKGQRGAVTGQGELKKIKFDPIFSLNHTCAMFRENVNRLRRKTWCTTKIAQRLELHMTLYALFHNYSLDLRLAQGAKGSPLADALSGKTPAAAISWL